MEKWESQTSQLPLPRIIFLQHGVVVEWNSYGETVALDWKPRERELCVLCCIHQVLSMGEGWEEQVMAQMLQTCYFSSFS